MTHEIKSLNLYGVSRLGVDYVKEQLEWHKRIELVECVEAFPKEKGKRALEARPRKPGIAVTKKRVEEY
jgi:hypothetical protein